MIDVILFALMGIGGGIVTGLIPGVHPNTLAAGILSASPLLLTIASPHAVAVFIIAMGIAHTFLSFIPSVFVGAPEGDTALSVLPGHRLLLNGRGHEAVYLTVMGGVGVMVLAVLLFPLLIFLLPFLYENISSYIAFILFAITALMVWTEHGVNKVKGLIVFGLAGFLGIIAMGTPIIPAQHLLFPIFTGLFGISTLGISLNSKFNVPEQKREWEPIPGNMSFIGIIKGFLSGVFVGILPGIGAAQAGVLVHQLTKGRSLREFLIALGGINTVAALFSLMALYLISRPRSGIAVAVQQVIGTFGFGEMLVLMATALFATGIAALATIRLSGWFSGLITKVDYTKLSAGIIAFLSFLVWIFTGPAGMFLLLVSTSIGLLPPLLGVKRTHAMGVLMLPIMLWYFGIAI